MAPDDPLRTYIERYCVSIARDRLLVQAAGGNVSWKSGDVLWVKASGAWLADADSKNIFVPVDRQVLNDALAHGDYAVRPMALDGYALRPSIETLLHALMPHTLVVHLHPVNVVAHLVRRNCEASLKAALGDVFSWDLIAYHKPGAELARAVHAVLVKKPHIQVLFLKNHGVILGAETLVEIDRLLQDMIKRLGVTPRAMNSKLNDETRFSSGLLTSTPYSVCTDSTIHSLANNPELWERLCNDWAICPDHVVFLGFRAIRINELAELQHVLQTIHPAPPFVFVKGVGVLENRAATPVQRAQLGFYLDVMVRQRSKQTLQSLSDEQIDRLINWDAEKYRQSFSRDRATRK